MNEPIRTQRTGRTPPIDSLITVITFILLVSAIPVQIALWRWALGLS